MFYELSCSAPHERFVDRLSKVRKTSSGLIVVAALFSSSVSAQEDIIFLRDHTCPTLADTRDCNSTCKPVLGDWGREIRLKYRDGEVVVISKKAGRVEGISSYKGCAIVDSKNWVCEPKLQGHSKELEFTNHTRNGSYFLMTKFRGKIMHALCSKR